MCNRFQESIEPEKSNTFKIDYTFTHFHIFYKIKCFNVSIFKSILEMKKLDTFKL